MKCPLCWNQLNEEEGLFCDGCCYVWMKCECGGFLAVESNTKFIGCIDCCMVFDRNSDEWKTAIGKFRYAECCCGRGIIVESEDEDSWSCECGLLWRMEDWDIRLEAWVSDECEGCFIGVDYEENPN